MDTALIIKMARGLEPADILLKNGRLINVYTGEIYPVDICMAHSRIVGLGEGYSARETYDLEGRHVCPGFIDAHVHIESAMVPPYEFARAVVPQGRPRRSSILMRSPTSSDWTAFASCLTRRSTIRSPSLS